MPTKSMFWKAQLRHARHYGYVLMNTQRLYFQGGESIRQSTDLFDSDWANIHTGLIWISQHIGRDNSSADLVGGLPVNGLVSVYLTAILLMLQLREHHHDEVINLIMIMLDTARSQQDRSLEGTLLFHLSNIYRGDPRQKLEVLEQVKELARETNDKITKDLILADRADAYLSLGQVDLALELYEEQSHLDRMMQSFGAPRHEGHTLLGKGKAYLAVNEPHRALELFTQSLRIANKARDLLGEGHASIMLASTHKLLKDPHRAVEYYERALHIFRELGDRSHEGTLLGCLGDAHSLLGNFSLAIEYYERALPILQEGSKLRYVANTFASLGDAYKAVGEVAPALECYEKAYHIATKIDDRHNQRMTLADLSTAYSSLGKIRLAMKCNKQALLIDREVGNRRGEASALGSLGNGYMNLGEARDAVACYEDALPVFREVEDQSGELAVLIKLGDAYVDSGRIHDAIASYDQAVALSTQISDDRAAEAALGNLGNAYWSLGDAHRAIDSYARALQIARKIGDLHGEGIAAWNMARAQDKLGNRAQAILDAEVALKIFERMHNSEAEEVRKRLDGWTSRASLSAIQHEAKQAEYHNILHSHQTFIEEIVTAIQNHQYSDPQLEERLANLYEQPAKEELAKSLMQIWKRGARIEKKLVLMLENKEDAAIVHEILKRLDTARRVNK